MLVLNLFPLKRDCSSYKAIPTKVHTSYQTKFQMHWQWNASIKILPLNRGHIFYQVQGHFFIVEGGDNCNWFNDCVIRSYSSYYLLEALPPQCNWNIVECGVKHHKTIWGLRNIEIHYILFKYLIIVTKSQNCYIW